MESKLHLKKDLQDVFGVKRILCLLPPSHLIIQRAFLYQPMVSASPQPQQLACAYGKASGQLLNAQLSIPGSLTDTHTQLW